MTDREFAQKVLDRQEHLIGAMHAMLDQMQIIRDVCLETRKAVFGLDEWLRRPAADDFAEAVAKMTTAMNTLADRTLAEDEDGA
jgi:hypothetical protein